MTTITPFLWFDADLAEPVAHYTSIFPDSRVLDWKQVGPDGPVFGATINLCGQDLHLLNGGPACAGFTEAISLFVAVDDQAEIDRLWDALLADGGEPSQCGWLKDKYGLVWQITPTMLGDVLGGPDPEGAARAQQAMMGMVKLDIAALQAAYDGTEA